jgi:glycosyltransferase involved in cell wall biosynthesis
MMKKKTIVHVIDSLMRGGAETLLYGIFNDVAERYNIVLVTLTGETDFDLGKLNHTAIYSLGHRGNKDFLRSIIRLRKIIKRHKPDLVRSQLYWSTVVAKLACPRNVKFVFSIHITQGDEFYEKSKLLYWLDKYTYKKRHAIIYVTKTAGEDFNKWIGFKGRHFLLYNMVQDVFFLNQFKPFQNKSAYRIILVGNLKEQKNYFFLLDALRMLQSPNIYCDIYGQGPLHNELNEKIKQQQLNVTLKGKSDEVWNLLPQYDLYLLCSKREGFGIAAAEAMASGLPVLLSDIAVLREISKDNAVFFDPLDPQSLVTALQKIIDHEVDLESLSKKGMLIAKEYSKKYYLDNLFGIYEKILNEG